MENNTKYYTPSIEEFHVGFEYEYCDYQSEEPSEWYAARFGCDYKKAHDIGLHNCLSFTYEEWEYILQDFINKEYVRVKYLDKEDIEDLGFIYDNKLKFPKGKYKTTVVEYVNDIYCLSTFDNHEIMISEYCDGVFDKLFEGTIKNKSELKRVLKQLGING